MESEVIRPLEGLDGKVVAVGGGAVISGENRAILKKLGPVMWLKASPDVIVKRIEKSGRPALRCLELSEE